MIKTTFIFCSLSNWLSGIIGLSLKNHAWATIASFLVSGSAITVEYYSTRELFGTTTLVLLMVFATILANTVTGVWKNTLKARIYLATAQGFPTDTKQHRLNIRRWNAHKYDLRKIMFVFFKGLSFLTYLTMVKALTTDGVSSSGEWEIKALYITTETLIRVPIALFWYYEFKSIGENSEYIFKKKAMIFTIAEWIFEPRILKFIGGKTPADGSKNNIDPNL